MPCGMVPVNNNQNGVMTHSSLQQRLHRPADEYLRQAE